MSNTRSNDLRLIFIGEAPRVHHLQINGCKLPTYSQVLLCYLANIDKLKMEDPTKQKKLGRLAANLTVKQVIPHYHKSKIFTIAENKMADKILALVKDFENLKKLNPERRVGNPVIKTFQEKMCCALPFWPRNILAKMEQKKYKKTVQEIAAIDDDIAFLHSMMGDRKWSYDSVDVNVTKLEMNRNKRQMKEELQKNEDLNQDQDFESSESSEDESQKDTIPIFSLSTPKRSHKRVVKTGTTVFIPHDILKSPQVVSAATRNKITPTALSAAITTVIDACGGNTSAVNLHWSTAYRYKVEACSSIARRIKEAWTPPRVDLLHWDGKLMDTLDNSKDKEERLPVLISGIGGTKLLGVPNIPYKSSDKAGAQIANATKKLLEDWNCLNSPSGMVFDTTSANTGHKTAGCVAVQETLDRHLLWFACRHHVGEIILTHVWDALNIEVSKKPEVTVFERFQDNFDKLTHGDVEGFDFPQINIDLIDQKNEMIKMAKDLLKQSFVRGDYKELVTLVLLYLDGGEGFSDFDRPGALHKARWMAKLLYSIKMVLLDSKIKHELPKGSVFAAHQSKKLKRFVQFAVFCYFPWWATAPVTSSAPYNDVLLLKGLEKYKQIDQVCANAAIKAFSNHLWYLTEELVVLGLFSSCVSDLMKARMAEKMISNEKKICSKRMGPSKYGKPCFPKLPAPEADFDLSDFMGEDSWSFFHILKLKSSFISLPVKEWPANCDFQEGKRVVDSLSVVNDGAERGVKLAHNFLDAAKTNKNFQNILQVVENDRKSVPNQRKRKVQSKTWFLHLQ